MERSKVEASKASQDTSRCREDTRIIFVRLLFCSGVGVLVGAVVAVSSVAAVVAFSSCGDMGEGAALLLMFCVLISKNIFDVGTLKESRECVTSVPKFNNADSSEGRDGLPIKRLLLPQSSHARNK